MDTGFSISRMRFFVAILLALVVCLPRFGRVVGQDSKTDSKKQLPPGGVKGLWDSHVESVLQTHCTRCHGKQKRSGKLDLRTIESVRVGGKNGPVIDTLNPDQSRILQLLQPDSKPHMPPGKQLSQEEIQILRTWVSRLAEKPGTGSNLETEPAKQTEPAKILLAPTGIEPNLVIDLYIQKRWKERNLQSAGRADDDQFARRIYLDLIGRIPSLEELNRFRANRSSRKREQLVDQLLNSQDHARFFATLFDSLLMGRGKPKVYANRAKHKWLDYLETAFSENRPWSQVVAEILEARPGSEKSAGATWYLYERNNNYQSIAESIGPGFFGVRIECAQCHDHPLAGEIEQRHYWGLVAFFRRGKNVLTPAGPRIAESAVGGFEEFTDLSGTAHPNHLVFLGNLRVDEKRPLNGRSQQEKENDSLYLKKTGNEPRVPKFSRRKAFVDHIVAGNPRIAETMVNRIWALLLGRGLVHPHDRMDSAHPPSHPDLLLWLARDFEDHNQDVRRLIRQIVLSRVYQLDSTRPRADTDPADFTWFLEKPLPAEAWVGSIEQLVGNTRSQEPELLQSFREQFPDVLPDAYSPRLSQAMFLSNGDPIQRYLRESDSPDHIFAQLMAIPTDRQRIRELFQRALARDPDEQEIERTEQFLQRHREKPDHAWEMIVWALITGSEFRINH